MLRRAGCAQFGWALMTRWINYKEKDSKLAERRWNVSSKSGPCFCSRHFLLSFSFGESYRQACTISSANSVYQIYLNSTSFLCHLDFLPGLTLKSGHCIYSSACLVASMTKPFHSRQRFVLCGE